MPGVSLGQQHAPFPSHVAALQSASPLRAALASSRPRQHLVFFQPFRSLPVWGCKEFVIVDSVFVSLITLHMLHASFGFPLLFISVAHFSIRLPDVLVYLKGFVFLYFLSMNPLLAFYVEISSPNVTHLLFICVFLCLTEILVLSHRNSFPYYHIFCF